MRGGAVLRACLGLASVFVLASCGGGADEEQKSLEAGTAAVAAEPEPELQAKARKAPAAVPGRFIVRLHDRTPDPESMARGLAAPHGGQVHHTYSHAIKGFSVSVPPVAQEAFLNAMQHNPHVDLVEEDQEATGVATQTSAGWGLDRVDQRALPLSGTFGYNGTGVGVRAYILDSGIRATHWEFGGRVLPGYTVINDGWGTGDCHGHGTHVAGTVAGASFGIAKQAAVVPVRVLGCDNTGYVSGIIAGIDWMVANAVKPAVANISIGAGASSTFDAAVARAVGAGITVAVAAGNNNADACRYSPSREPSAITVGATTSIDDRASYSNWGTCLDLFAPGSSITSASGSADNLSAVMSGTSMAAPHVAGVAAVYLQANPAASPATVTSVIRSAATANVVRYAGSGSPNALLYSVLDGVVVSEPVTTAISVASLTGSAARKNRHTWHATATVAVKNASGALVPGAVVTGGFSVGGTGLSCTTASTGRCSIASGNIGSATAQTTFTVTGLSGSGMSYDAAANAASSVVIAAP